VLGHDFLAYKAPLGTPVVVFFGHSNQLVLVSLKDNAALILMDLAGGYPDSTIGAPRPGFTQPYDQVPVAGHIDHLSQDFCFPVLGHHILTYKVPFGIRVLRPGLRHRNQKKED
jgi:hypothetical protein